MTTIDALIDSVSDDMQKVERLLYESAASSIEILEEISTYILSSGGKRLRPLILLLSARFCDYRGEQHILLACVLEYIHTATLLHDDVIDHAEIRRGNSTANVLWGNQSTILAGDFLFSKAFSMAVHVNNHQILKAIARASECLAEAETLQVSKTGDPLISEEEYLFIIKNKAAILMAAASMIGGVLGGVDERRQHALEEYGYNLGMAFQIMDDVLDYYSSEKVFGKTIGKDFQEGNVTLPFIAALESSTPADRQQMEDICRGTRRGGTELTKIISLIEKYDGNTRAIEKAKQFAQQAVQALESFDDTRKKQPLIDFAEYIVERRA